MQPAYIDTPLAAPVLENKEKMAVIEARTPLRRVGQPEEVSGQLHGVSATCLWGGPHP